MNFNQFLDHLLAEPAADNGPSLGADRTKPHPRNRRLHRAADGTLLACDTIPLVEAIGDAKNVTRAPRSDSQVCFDTPPRT